MFILGFLTASFILLLILSTIASARYKRALKRQQDFLDTLEQVVETLEEIESNP